MLEPVSSARGDQAIVDVLRVLGRNVEFPAELAEAAV